MILVTGGAGYIGSHTVLALLRRGLDVVVVDDLSNSSATAIERVRELADRDVELHIFDLRDRARLREVFERNPIDVVIHFAGYKAVGESVERPLAYYDNNLNSTISLCSVMDEFGVRRLVFSSSATVYGVRSEPELTESMPLAPQSPYGQTKAMIEQILRDLAATGRGWQIASLRYFNPVGADPSGRIGEDPIGTPNNLLPFVAQVAVGRRDELLVFGDDYPTSDGTGVRDYVHVSDLAAGHLAAIERLPEPNSAMAINLGTGRGHSVLEVVRAFEAASDRSVPYRVVARRPGDVEACWAAVTTAKDVLGWRSELTLADACRDAWRWQRDNPQGYRTPS